MYYWKYHIPSKYKCLCLCKFLKSGGYVSFIFVSAAPGHCLPRRYSVDGHWWVMTGSEWNSEDIDSVFCNAVAYQWLTTLMHWHFHYLKCWEACSQKPWEHIMEQDLVESERNHYHKRCLAFLLEEGKYWTLKLWAVLHWVLVPTGASLVCLGSTGLGIWILGQYITLLAWILFFFFWKGCF